MIPWELHGAELVNCNCSYACPCQFNALPTEGHCEAAGALSIDEGYYGDVKLDGLRCAFVFQWPGPIHEGRGQCQPIVDERASQEQRGALLKILSGQDSEPGKTHFYVFASTLEKVHDPIFAHIDMECDVEARRGTIRIGELLRVEARPIKNPVTGEDHRVRIDLPHGFEYLLAEIGSGSAQVTGNVPMNLENSYAQFVHLHMNNHGPIREAVAA